MALVQVRPYPVLRLREVRSVLDHAAIGELGPLQGLVQAACAALSTLDPDEVAEWQGDWKRAPQDPEQAARAAVAAASCWEGIVAVGAMLQEPSRFRGFLWTASHLWLELPGGGAGRFRAYAQGAWHPDLSPEDSCLFAALPALVGLGPELPQELPAWPELEGLPVFELMGLPPADYEGIDPLDARAVPPTAWQGLDAPPAWRALLREATEGLLVRRPD